MVRSSPLTFQPKESVALRTALIRQERRLLGCLLFPVVVLGVQFIVLKFHVDHSKVFYVVVFVVSRNVDK